MGQMARRSGGGGDGLAGLMRGLKLSEEERSSIKGAWMTGERDLEQVPQAVGRLFSGKPGFVDGMV